MRLTKIRRITLLILVFVVCLMPASGQAYNPDSTDAYVFPYSKMTSEEREAFWALPYEEGLKLEQVPDYLLHTMSTEGLIETCLNGPGFGNQIPYQLTFDKHLTKFNFLQEILVRENAGAKLLERYRQTDLGRIALLPEGRQTSRELRKVRRIELLLAQDVTLSKLQKEERYELLNVCLEKISIKQKYPEAYDIKNLGSISWVLVGRILKKENFEPFVEEIEENENLMMFIEQSFLPNFSYRNFMNIYSDTTIYDEILRTTDLSVEQFLKNNSEGEE